MSTTALSATQYFYVRPTDSLFLRGNLAFGASGEHGSGSLPPPPSLLAGAFRSALLGGDAAQLAAFLDQGQCSDAALARCLGTPQAPGDFALRWLSLAAEASPGAVPDAVSPLPADLLRLKTGFAPLRPQALPSGMCSSGPLPLRPVLYAATQAKPDTGVWLGGAGWARHLQGELPDDGAGIAARQLFQRDPRLGIGLDGDSRTAEEGLLYTTDGFAFSPQAGLAGPGESAPKGPGLASSGFLVGLAGVGALLPDHGSLRLGGDGRSASYRRVAFVPPALSLDLAGQRRFRLILQTPGLFPLGWLPTGVAPDGRSYRLQGEGFSAELVCAALGRREVVSGWDLARWVPKPAQAAVPAGSVFWFDRLEGDPGKLAAWVAGGLWPYDPDSLQCQRRAEGYNLALLAAWP